MTDGVEYVASAPELEACSEREAIQNSVYGGMPIQIGYCNGTNHTLNAVEYHRDSEIDIALDGAILLIGSEQDVEDDFTYDTAKMEAFAAPAGCSGRALRYHTSLCTDQCRRQRELPCSYYSFRKELTQNHLYFQEYSRKTS